MGYKLIGMHKAALDEADKARTGSLSRERLRVNVKHCRIRHDFQRPAGQQAGRRDPRLAKRWPTAVAFRDSSPNRPATGVEERPMNRAHENSWPMWGEAC